MHKRQQEFNSLVVMTIKCKNSVMVSLWLVFARAVTFKI